MAKQDLPYLRTPEERFEHLPDFPYKPHYLQYRDLRMAYVDEHNGEGSEVFLCLHGEPTWSYLYRKMIPVLLNYTTSSQELSRRIVAPDLFGFGRSDKPSQDSDYSFDFHRDSILYLIESLNLTNITLVVQDWGGLIGLTLPITDPSRFKRFFVMNTALGRFERSQGILDWISFTNSNPDMDIAGVLGMLGLKTLSKAEIGAYEAPFPDKTYKGGVRRFPNMLMIKEDMPGVELCRKSQHFYETTNSFKDADVFVACGIQDPLLGPHMKALARMWKHGCYYAEIEEASHFVQEWGDKVARLAIEVFEKQSKVAGVQRLEPVKLDS